MRKIFFVFLAVFCFGISKAQKERTTLENTGFLPVEKALGEGSVTIVSDEKLHILVKKHIETNEDKFPGWRVQIYFGSGKSAMGTAKKIKEKFVLGYGKKYGSYIVYDSPFFKVRAGDFRTKAEAMKFKQNISKKYPNSWVVPDMVNYPEKN